MTTEQVSEAEDTSTEQETGAARMAAPYMPGKSFTNSFEKYAADGLPDVFDKSYFGNISGSTVAQTRATMRYFDLIDENYAPTDLMRGLVDADEDTRRETLKMMVEDKYSDLLALSLNATAGQLNKMFNERGITGATVDKAVSFYLHMLDYVGISYSKNFKRRTASNGGTRRRAPKKQAAAPEPPVVHQVKPKVSLEDEKKGAYLDALLALATKDDTDAAERSELFDRFEKALGIGTATGGGGDTNSP